MKKRSNAAVFYAVCCFFILLFFHTPVEAKVTAEQKKEYVDTLGALIRNGTESRKLDAYAEVAKGNTGKKALRQAAMQNRAALMAEGIDALDENWTNYYAVDTRNGRTIFNSTKTIGRKAYRRRYHKIMRALSEVLACVEPGMTDADKAMAVYYYLAKNTVYEQTSDCHTGYDVLVSHKGVCDGFANAYALALNTLGIRCAVVSNYTKDHSWNLVEIDGQWYFCDLTNGIGNGNTEGMVVSYSSCLVGAESFLSSHPGYTMKDIYGEANSDGLNIRKLPLAQSDYIPPRSSIRTGISSRTCLFYQGGWWYWISTGNMLKKSRLNGSGEQTVYAPADDAHIGWAEEFDEMILISINDRIYRMNYKGQLKGEVRQVLSTEYRHAVSSYFWQIAYVGRFYRNADDTIGYYITDLTGARKGVGQISLSGMGKQYGKPKITKRLKLQAGFTEMLYIMRTTPAGARRVKWKSSDPGVAQVDKYGYVTAKKKGTAVITASVGDKKVRCTVKVSGYTITYKKASVNAAGNIATASGKKQVTLREPKKKGFIFKGWYTEKGYKNKITSIRKGNGKNYVLYARWEKPEEE